MTRNEIKLPRGEAAAWADKHLREAKTPAELEETWRTIQNEWTGMGRYYATRTPIAQREIDSVYQQYRAKLGKAAHATKRENASGDRRVWAFLNGEPFSAMVKKGQVPSAAVALSLKKKLGAPVTLWPQEDTPSGSAYRAQWFDPKSEKFREARIEIWRLS